MRDRTEYEALERTLGASVINELTRVETKPTRRAGTGIPTVYRGIEYRSRLEARWAAFFDAFNWQHTYEPFDGNGYIPDFMIMFPRRPLIIEVKPAAVMQDFRDHEARTLSGLAGHWDHDVMIVGTTPMMWRPVGNGMGWLTTGLHPLNWAPAMFLHCLACSRWYVAHADDQSCRFCGSLPGELGMSEAEFQDWWGLACTLTKWRRK